MNLCCIDGCEKEVYRGGMCNMHRLRVKRYGDPHFTKKIHTHPSDEARAEAKKASAQRDYQKNSEAYKAKANRWREENPERYRANIRAYLDRKDVQERARTRTRQWAKDNPEAKRELDRKFNSENIALVRSYKAKRRAAIRQAVPWWLTDDDKAAIVEFYEEAERLTIETGIPHEVDHIVPLQGRTVCGLHVPWNLRVLTKNDNNRRPRIWSAE